MAFEENTNARLDSLEFNNIQLAGRVRMLEKMIDTKATPLWKRVWFRVDGWPAWYHVASKRQWRPWHRYTIKLPVSRNTINRAVDEV